MRYQAALHSGWLKSPVYRRLGLTRQETHPRGEGRPARTLVFLAETRPRVHRSLLRANLHKPLVRYSKSAEQAVTFGTVLAQARSSP